MMEFYKQRVYKAKQSHTCEMCGRAIEAGEEYSKEVGKFYGDFFERVMHLNCFEMFTIILDEMGEYEFSWDDFPDWWADNKCPNCVNFHPICKPDKDCRVIPSACSCKNSQGRCTDENCFEMTHVGWCEKFQERGGSE